MTHTPTCIVFSYMQNKNGAPELQHATAQPCLEELLSKEMSEEDRRRKNSTKSYLIQSIREIQINNSWVQVILAPRKHKDMSKDKSGCY